MKDFFLSNLFRPLKPYCGYFCQDPTTDNDLPKITLLEQDAIWLRADKRPDMLLCLGTRKVSEAEKSGGWVYDYRLRYSTKASVRSCIDAILSSLFYIELIGIPKLLKPTGFLCQAQIRCRLAPSSTAYIALIDRLWTTRACFSYNSRSISCVDRELLDEVRQHIAFSKYLSFTVMSLEDIIDVRVDMITQTSQSISNCPYIVQTLIEDQGLQCKFGHRDHQIRFLDVYEQ
jgi:hypothetical protein